MYTFVNYRLDSCDKWTKFDDNAAAEKFIRSLNGNCTIRRGKSFNQQWIQEELEDREAEYATPSEF